VSGVGQTGVSVVVSAVCRYSKTARNGGTLTLKSSQPVVTIAMSEKLTKADELCKELAETLSQNPDTVEITITIPHPTLGTTIVTGDEIEKMAAGELFRLDRGTQTRIEQDE